MEGNETVEEREREWQKMYNSYQKFEVTMCMYIYVCMYVCICRLAKVVSEF